MKEELTICGFEHRGRYFRAHYVAKGREYLEIDTRTLNASFCYTPGRELLGTDARLLFKAPFIFLKVKGRHSLIVGRVPKELQFYAEIWTEAANEYLQSWSVQFFAEMQRALTQIGHFFIGATLALPIIILTMFGAKRTKKAPRIV